MVVDQVDVLEVVEGARDEHGLVADGLVGDVARCDGYGGGGMAARVGGHLWVVGLD